MTKSKLFFDFLTSFFPIDIPKRLLESDIKRMAGISKPQDSYASPKLGKKDLCFQFNTQELECRNSIF